MSLYLLKRPDNDIGYDEVDGVIVCASTAKRARQMAADNCGDEGGVWLDPKRATCQLIHGAMSPGIVLRSFRAG